MRNTIYAVMTGSALLAGSAFAGNVVAPQSAPSCGIDKEVHVGYNSQYIWRGVNVGDDMVEAGIDLAGTCDMTGLDWSAGAWYASQHNFTGDELDLYAEVSKDLGFARAHVGYIFYHFPETSGADSHEVYFGLSQEVAGFDTSLTYYWDVAGFDNEGYLEASAAKSFNLLGHDLDASVVLAYLVEESDLSHVTAKVSHDISVGENATLTPYIAHTWELEGLETFSGGAEENTLFAGANLTLTF